MNDNVVKIVKVVGMALSVAGMVASAWAGDKQMGAMIEKIVDEKLSN